MSQLKTYRVWMKDGFASLQNAESEDDAKAQAIKYFLEGCGGVRMTPAERRKATTVDYAECLSD